MGIWYATREQIKSSMEVAQTAWIDSLIDAKLESASRSAEKFLHRRFYPELRTVRKDWPNNQYAPTRQIWLDDSEIISLSSLTSGGVSIPTGNVMLRRGDDIEEPPYSYMEIDLSTSSALSAGTTFQRSNVMTGVFGFNETDTSVPAHGLLGGNINSSVTSIVINPTSGKLAVGVGSLLMIGTERLVITERQMSDTTANVLVALTASNADKIVSVADGTLFARGEVILVDAERMRVNDIAGNNLVVSRSWDGSALDSHDIGSDIYAEHTFTVKRGALGSTAAAHNSGDSVYAHEYPGPVNELTVAETVVLLEQNSSGYARTVGSGPNLREAKGAGLDDIRQRAWLGYGRKSRKGAV